MKKILIHLRTSIKLISLVAIAALLIFVAVFFIYKPIYSVSLNGEFIGYSKDKSKLQAKINDYMENGDKENVAFVQIDNMPEYKMCLLKKGIVTDDEGIFEKVKQTGTNYYTYYAIAQDGEEKLYVSNFEEAEKIIQELKNKNSENKDKLTAIEKYSTELQEFTTFETAVASLYKERVVVKSKTTVASNRSLESFSTSRNMSNQKVNLGISLARPVSGTITSKFGNNSSVRSGSHTGLDIAAPHGTPIKAAAGGTVIFSGTKGSYGKMIIISHGNGVQTYYGHCSNLVASVGQTVSQGQVIANVGSTGNSTGNHLHLEIRVNGVAQNPQNYLY